MRVIPYFAILLLLLLTACSGSSGGDTSPDDDSGPLSGLSSRPVNASCHASTFTRTSSIELQRVFPSLNFTRPILLLPHPSAEDVWYVLQQNGLIFRVENDDREEVVDLRDYYNISTCPECGLLGMAFDPDFADNGYIYLSFMEGAVQNNRTSFLARFVSQDNGLTLALDPENNSTLDRFNLIEEDGIPQDFDNHNGGHIAFSPDPDDDYLYFGLGDGGSGNDPNNRAQTFTNLLGSMLRLTRDGAPAPGNNVPGGLPEIYAYGLRNPWRWSFDRETGDLWLGDVGQGEFEEIDIIVNGGNYGWRCYEGFERTSISCSTSGPYIDPVAVYGRDEGFSVTGGYVYRGDEIPGLYGVYIFGDFGTGNIWGLFPQTGGGYERQLLLDSGRAISSFGEGPDGELYVIDYGNGAAGTGAIYRIVEDTSTPDNGPPQLLSETGCVNASNPAQAAAGLIPYTINEAFWSDGATKERYLALPNSTTIQVNADGDLTLPVDTVLMKQFRLSDQPIETRLFVRGFDGGWRGFSYRWNDALTDAELLDDALDEDIDGVLWHYPSNAQCNQCHTAAAGFALGPETLQLNKDFTYPSTGITANQLDTWQAIGLFANNPSADQRAQRLPASNDTSASLTQRARAYLHSNCANCHRPNGPTSAAIDLRFTTALADTDACDIAPTLGDLDIINARIIAPGDANRSVLLQRMLATDEHRMPPLSSSVVDEDGTELIAAWINSLGGCL
jgi:uncharacterized repeat protein (TIGR03806 family)